jgi:hypothetical protein
MKEFSVKISGIGQVSALGLGLAKLKEIRQPVPKFESIKTAEGDKEISFFKTAEPPFLSRIPEAMERRMSRLSKMFFCAAEEAIVGANLLDNWKSERTGLVVGTALGNLELANLYQNKILQQGPLAVSPNLFSSSLASSINAALSVTYEIKGPSSTVTIMEETPFAAFRLAYDWIKQDLADRVLVAIGDEISDYHRYFATAGKLSHPLGEGAVAFMLEKREEFDKSLGQFPDVLDVQLSNGSLPFEARSIKSHPDFYGSLITGAAFDVAIAAVRELDKKSILVVQGDVQLGFLYIELGYR